MYRTFCVGKRDPSFELESNSNNYFRLIFARVLCKVVYSRVFFDTLLLFTVSSFSDSWTLLF